jgi:pyruvate/2-oxoglutarate/acetoin dehydrogenase E1 component
MTWLGSKPDTVFVGQAVEFPGTAMAQTLGGVTREKLVELPVDEDFQLGLSTGLALSGNFVISIFPRWNFFVLALNQLVNHLDKFEEISGGLRPRVVIRTSVGSIRPLDPGPQHKGDLKEAIALLAPNVPIFDLKEPAQVFETYQRVYEVAGIAPAIALEHGDFHNEK